MEIDARAGSVGIDSILDRLIETLTNMRPVSAAEALAAATKKSCHSFIRVEWVYPPENTPIYDSIAFREQLKLKINK